MRTKEQYINYLEVINKEIHSSEMTLQEAGKALKKEIILLDIPVQEIEGILCDSMKYLFGLIMLNEVFG